jgi:sugar phosphate isomerase/epimerase
MENLTRRAFITRSAASLAGAAMIAPHLLRAETETLSPNLIGFQSWIVRESIEKDFAGTMKMMAGMGYKSMELCSPPGYAKSGFGSLQNLKASEMKRIINDAGLTCVSCHYGFDELKQHTQERIDFARELGLEQMILSYFGLPKTATLADWKTAADDLNKLGEQSKKTGLPMGYHNHNIEFEKLEGELIYDVLLKQLDPALIKMQFQVAAITAGYKAADYFKKYPGRFISAHLSDWSASGQVMPLGKGIVDWKEFFAAAKTGGVKNYFVEIEMPLMKESAEFLRSANQG